MYKNLFIISYYFLFVNIFSLRACLT